jgi:hypothetical protein
MSAIRVNKNVPKKVNLKRLAKKRKRIGTGDGGVISKKMLASR